MTAQNQEQMMRRLEVRQIVTSLLARNCVFFDTETTGLEWDAEIIEICAIDSFGKTLIDTLINPVQKLPRKITEITGITDAMLVNAPAMIAVWEKLRAVLNTRHLVAYNAGFDVRMLHQSAAQYKQIKRAFISFISATDAMQLVSLWFAEKDVRGGYKWFKLSEAAQRFGVMPDANLHRAAADTALLRAIFHTIAHTEDIQ